MYWNTDIEATKIHNHMPFENLDLIKLYEMANTL